MFEHLIQFECRKFSYTVQALNKMFKHSPFASFFMVQLAVKSMNIANPSEIVYPYKN